MAAMQSDPHPVGPQAGHSDLVVARATESEWEDVRSVRLAALAESPGAFGSTLARELEYDEPAWRDWCRQTATFLAVQDGAPVGMAAGVSGATPDERKLIAMWVRPGHRGRGASTALVGAVRDWALSDGATTLMLWVTRGNEAASSLYRRAGFSETGDSKPLPSNPAVIEDRLALDLR